MQAAQDVTGDRPPFNDRRQKERRRKYAREAQAARSRLALASRSVTRRMRDYLGRAAGERRRAAQVKLIQVGYAVEGYRSEAALSRFESGKSWPEQVDDVIAGYARALNENPRAIWERALEMWRADEGADFWDGTERRQSDRRSTNRRESP